MAVKQRALKDLTKLKGNPRTIKDDDFKRLVKSIASNPDYFKARPLILSDRTGELVILAGNQRYEAAKHLGLKQVPTYLIPDLTEEREREIIIRDNVSNGEWDYEALANEWEESELSDWGVDLPTIKQTELLSGLEYDPLYYEPVNKPNVVLADCVDLDKFNAKLEALNEYDLTDEQKEVLKLFAYRFIKIDFENVANYFHFNASDEEQKAMERLRLVLTDNGLAGFIEDDLIRLHDMVGLDFNPGDEE